MKLVPYMPIRSMSVVQKTGMPSITQNDNNIAFAGGTYRGATREARRARYSPHKKPFCAAVHIISLMLSGTPSAVLSSPRGEICRGRKGEFVIYSSDPIFPVIEIAFHKKREQVYRITNVIKRDDGVEKAVKLGNLRVNERDKVMDLVETIISKTAYRIRGMMA